MTPDAPLNDPAALRRRYDGLLLDAYGVLLDGERALPGAAASLDDLERDGCAWLVVTNAASRLPETPSQEFATVGLAIPPERILTSGALLADPRVAGDLRGVRALVLGPAGSRCYAEQASVLSLTSPAPTRRANVASVPGRQFDRGYVSPRWRVLARPSRRCRRAVSLRVCSAFRQARHNTASVLILPFATSYHHFCRAAGQTSSLPHCRHTTTLSI
jgi:ribonucleotide monophosphatase NagD (HAD superfamily)